MKEFEQEVKGSNMFATNQDLIQPSLLNGMTTRSKVGTVTPNT